MTKAPKPLGRGSVSFAMLPDGRRVFAHWQKLLVDQGIGWSPEEVLEWTFQLDGRALRIVDAKGAVVPHLSLNESFAEGRVALPLAAEAVTPDRAVVRFDDYYSHHLGSVSSQVTLTFDTTAMLVEYASVDHVDIST